MEPFPYRIERLSDERLPDVQRLLAEVLHKKVTQDYLKIKYDTRYLGVQYLSAIAYDGDVPIAFYGTVPQPFTHPSGAKMIGCHGVDSMTLDSYQRRGLHQKLALTTYAWMRAEGVSVVFAFHSENTYHSCKKLDWKEWGRLRGYWVKGAALPLAKVWRRLPILNDMHVSRVNKALRKFAIDPQAFTNSNMHLGWAVEYSPAFFASKRFHRQYLIALAGVKFWLSIDAVVRVGDAHFEDVDHFWRGVTALQSLCRRLGYGQILFQTYPGSAIDLALASKLDGFESWIAGYLDLAPGLDFEEYRPAYADQDSF
jgi:GNAT superfamily N-acetyltransferase